MEVILRVALPDRPGALAHLAGAVGDAGADISAVDVVEVADGEALDDLVVVAEGQVLQAAVEGIDALDGVRVVHVGPSRGLPGDAVARLALGLESLINGAMTQDDALRTLVGGLCRAQAVEFVPAAEAPRDGDRSMVLALDHRVLVVRREYRFTQTERHRAGAIVSACVEASRVRR